MHIRELKLKDAPLMLEWMHDESVVKELKEQFSSKTLADCEAFIRNSFFSKNNIHMAIVSDADEYMGTVSLKNIECQTAEFAIVVRNSAMHKGYAWRGMELIIKKAFEDFGLESLYWCVSRENTRAIKFYDKHNFKEALDIPNEIRRRYQGMDHLKWYSILKGDDINVRESVAGCKIMRIPTIPTINSGELSFFEGNRTIPFEIKRIYFISKVPKGVKRGYHSHKSLQQFIYCPYGCVRLILENENGRDEIELRDPSIGVLIDKPTWREMLWMVEDSVLCVAASDYYSPDDYIRDYDEFRNYLKVQGEFSKSDFESK